MTLALVCPSGAVRSASGRPLSPRSLHFASIVRASVRYAVRSWSIPLAEEDVEDLTQETLLRLWTRYPNRWERYPRRLVNRVAATVVIDAARGATAGKRDRRLKAGLDAIELSVVTEPKVLDALIARELLAERIAACRRALTSAQFRILVLAYLAGLSSREVAAKMQRGVSTVDATASRLRTRLACQGITLSRRMLRGGAS